MQNKLTAQAQLEKEIHLQFTTFSDYMGRFLRSLPWALRLVYRAKMAFQIPSLGEWWGLDFGRQKIFCTHHKPLDCAFIIAVDPAVLQDAMEKSIVNFIDISKRLHVELQPGCPLQYFIFQQLLVLFEMGNFPLRNNLNTRFIQVWFARRAELLSYARKALSGARFFIPKVGTP
jgi:hypothetical protein